MNTEHVLDELIDAAGRLGIEVRTEKGNFRGGHCRVGGERQIVLNKRHLPETRLAVLAGCLREEAIDTVYLKPAVRRALGAAWSDLDARETERDAASESNATPEADDDAQPAEAYAD